MKVLKTFAAIAVVLTSFITASCGKKSSKQEKVMDIGCELVRTPQHTRADSFILEMERIMYKSHPSTHDLTKEDSLKIEEFTEQVINELKNDTIKQY